MQQAQADLIGIPLEVTNSVDMDMRYIPASICTLGSSIEQVQWALGRLAGSALAGRYADYINSEAPQRVALIDEPFRIGTTEVTVGQFRAFVDATGYKTVAEREGTGYNYVTREQGPDFSWRNTGLAQDDTHPVVNLAQADCIAFCDWLSEQESEAYRLPTETEWEYACRAGSQGHWCFGDDENEFFRYGWSSMTAESSTHPVGQLRPNAFGIYDMHGNVREWVTLNDGSLSDADGTGVVRGGSFTKTPVLLRSASRVGFNTGSPYPYHGFRVVMDVSVSLRLLDDQSAEEE